MSAARRLLIVNADDYGLTDGIARGVLRAHRDGVLTSTSVLAVGPAVRRTARWLADAPALGVGAHLALIGVDPPLLTRREIPTLVTRDGGFPREWRRFLARAAAGRIDPADVERELDAQVERLVGECGLNLTHLDTHQHLHLWPPVADVVVALARRWRIGAVRLPSSRAGGPKGAGIRRLSAGVRRRLTAAGLVSPGAYAGLDEAGRLTLPTFRSALERLTESSATAAEINCHPGEAADPEASARYEWGFARAGELDALTSPELRDAVDHLGWRLGTYADLARETPAEPR
ncbi:carbohydrate deacetylase [Saccharothrix hoggarensis]|uniref:Carbohydrate deacetylase n=1 Tax=Saccharothrix hoggarensis TaxID=913853 RepID=A0ABW3R4V9_9PSEU